MVLLRRPFRNIQRTRDTLWIEIPIRRVDPPKSEILLVQAPQLAIFKKNMPDIDYLLKSIRPNTFDGLKIGCFGETQESVDALFEDPHIRKYFANLELSDCIQSLHITDMKVYNNFDFFIKV
jgi:hypothetical protein